MAFESEVRCFIETNLGAVSFPRREWFKYIEISEITSLMWDAMFENRGFCKSSLNLRLSRMRSSR